MRPVGRFAPTPSGRMHMGNLFAALLAWLSIRKKDGLLILRMEDLDTQRTSPAYADTLRRDLEWLGLTWDKETQPQSQRTAHYEEAVEKLKARGLLYPCYCSRNRLHSINAPHLGESTFIYDGHCRDLTEAQRQAMERPPAWRLMVPEREMSFVDRLQGPYRENLAKDCGDFVLRRSDGMYVYQLAVVVDDAAAGVTEVVRGRDLLSSCPRQMYLQELLGYPRPEYCHVPLLLSADGRRLSKRDRDMDLSVLSKTMGPEEILGRLSFWAGLQKADEATDLQTLLTRFSWERVNREDIVVTTDPQDSAGSQG